MGVTVDVPSPEVMGRAADAIRKAVGAEDVSWALVSAAAGPDLATALDERVDVSLDAVAGLPAAWRDGAAGHVVAGRVAGRVAVAWTSPAVSASPATSAFGARVAIELGVPTFVVSAAATPLNPVWMAGGVGLVADHINLSGANPLVGPNIDAHGPRFPDMSFVYDAALRRQARSAALSLGIQVLEGTLACVAHDDDGRRDGKLLRSLGADAASTGMVADAIVARHAARRVLGLLDVRGRGEAHVADAGATDLGPLVRRTIESMAEAGR